MTDDAVADAAAILTRRKTAIGATTEAIRRRFDPRLIASDVAKVAMAHAITQLGGIQTTPRQRKRALVGAGVAAVTAIGLRVVYRISAEKNSPKPLDDVKRTE